MKITNISATPVVSYGTLQAPLALTKAGKLNSVQSIAGSRVDRHSNWIATPSIVNVARHRA
jgi:hypothetical protein